jgi:glycosyltransferase involved in cell wall biosynthesis
MGRPKVCVCIPVYNGARYIAESVESVLSQTLGDLRVFVCDNCSTDATGEIVQTFKDPRVTYLRSPVRLSAVGNHNRCLSVADGEYVCLWHHDDVMLPTNLERKVEFLDAHPHVGFVHSNLLRVDADGRPFAEHWAAESRQDCIETGREFVPRYLMRMHSFGSLVFIGAVVARRACYERVGWFREALSLSFDDEMWMRLALHFDVGCLGEPLVKYRVHPDSLTSSAGAARRLEEHLLASRLVLDQVGGRLPEASTLRHGVAVAFWKRAFLEAARVARKGDVRGAWAYVRVGIEAYPRFWAYPGAVLGWGVRRVLRAAGAGAR